MSKFRLVFMEIVIGLESDHIRLHSITTVPSPTNEDLIQTQYSRACNPLETNTYPNKLAYENVSKHHFDIFCSLN